MKKIICLGKVVLNSICGVFVAISIVSIATLTALNLNFVYKFIIEKYNLVSITGVSPERLVSNYKGLINYLQNPFIGKLKFEDFHMSKYGEIHFYEVKMIFSSLTVISIFFILFVILYFIFSKIYNRNCISLFVKNLNLGANILIGFFIVIILAYIIDFSKAFLIFHKIFFRNNYWMFDPNTDEIINALPEELFMIYGAIILLIIIVASILIKFIYRKVNN